MNLKLRQCTGSETAKMEIYKKWLVYNKSNGVYLIMLVWHLFTLLNLVYMNNFYGRYSAIY